MAAFNNTGAAAPKSSTSTSDNAPGQGREVEEQAQESRTDCAADALRKRVATAQARAALLGLMLDRLADGAWLLSYAAFSGAGQVRTLLSLQAVEGALAAFEQVHQEVRAQVSALAHRRRDAV